MKNIELNKLKEIHFVGIGGIGMRGIAEYLLHDGYSVSGSDLNTSQNTDFLESAGVSIYIGHKESNIQKPDLVVYSSAIPEKNIELITARNINIPTIKRSEMLGLITQIKKYCIAICGTHGKTTTTSMVSKVFEYAELDPVTIVGGIDANFGSTTRLGNGDVIIVEADEFDKSFLKLSPTHIAITSIDLDHQEDYHSIENVKQVFLQFINNLPKDGIVALCENDINTRKIIPQISHHTVSYGIDTHAEIMATNIHISNGLIKCIVNTPVGSCSMLLQLPGNHNIQNALAAVSLGLEFGIPLKIICEALSHFKGVERRMEIIHESNKMVLIDDYAHHPAEIEATIKAVRSKWKRRIIAIFQPHLYSRTQSFYKEFAETLNLADVVIVTGIYPAREEPISGISGEMIVNEFSRRDRMVYIENKSDVPKFLKKIMLNGDLIITMGAGDINLISKNILELVQSI